MNCERVRALFDSFAAGTADREDETHVEAHLEDCPSCARELLPDVPAIADAGLYFRAPRGLRERIMLDVERERPTARKTRPSRPWFSLPLAFAAGIAASALVTVFVLQGGSRGDLVARDVVSSHVRSLMADHLTDVPSSDKHTVKPWFDGKIDFAPPVTDLDPQGFTLLGGRLDYVSGRPAAALVYKRRQHFINLFVLQGEAAAAAGDIQGYNFVHWNRNGMSFWAVSDLNPDELQQFAQLLQN